MLCARTDDFPGRSAQYRDVMTVAVADTYTGHVETRTAARRTLPGEHQGLRGPDGQQRHHLVTCANTASPC